MNLRLHHIVFKAWRASWRDVWRVNGGGAFPVGVFAGRPRAAGLHALRAVFRGALGGSGWRSAVPLGLAVLALAILCAPTVWTLAQTVWQSDDQNHGPLVLAASALLLWQRRHELEGLQSPVTTWPGWLVLLPALLALAFGRSQGLLTIEAAALVVAGAGVVLVFKGRPGLRVCGFALAFLAFAIPWPEALVGAVTQPLKTAVSAVSESLLHAAGYPIGRAGVTMTVGPYEVLVADACAGLNSMFVLEAITVLYIKLFNDGDRVHDLWLALLAIPIAFAANVLRVLVLVLLLFHFGDDAARDFIHGFAGLLLMCVALTLTLAADTVIRALRRPARRHRQAAAA